ncbi:hypothetical protein [Parasitella parasitica]|uniref:Methyltransferase domain-containing protein n=1 Tax=Parasitella parasitica TaxID=35722 RepID=A0A0B7MW40_9FUNG|nr:hypothetical protein [Parasitella parasitica]
MGNEQSKPALLDSQNTTAASYPTVTKAKKPLPYAASFFDTQNAAPLSHQYVRKPNRHAGNINFFEVAATTAQPARSMHSSSSSKSSIKTASTNKNSSLYPTSSHNTREKKSTSSSTNSFTASSIASTTVQREIMSVKASRSDLVTDESEYVVLHNRRYWRGHGAQSFMLPCDDDESDRLMTMHYILKATFHGNFAAPVYSLLENPNHKTKVLDIGCGSGTWILELATEFPNTEFYGIDNCPLFPNHIKPNNSHFRLHNVLEGLPYHDSEFDYVHMRMMIYYFSPEELSQLLTEISRIMKPGGYFEITDTSYTVRHAGPVSNKAINSDLKQILHSRNHSLSFNSLHESSTNHPIFSLLMVAPQEPATSFIGNFIDICQEHATLPIGGWEGGQIGNLHSLNFKSLLQSIISKDEELPLNKSLVDSIIEECERYKSYLDWFSCYARKPPLEGEQIEQSTLDSIYEFVEGFVDV